MLNIIADENIPFVNEAFSTLGEVITLPGRSIKTIDLKSCDVLLVRSVTQINQSLLDGTSVQFVASATSGIDHIDKHFLQQQGIGFAYAPGCNAISVAQYVLSAVAQWSLMQNKSLNELSLGIVGCGRIGGVVKNLCHYFSIDTVIHDPPLAAKHSQLQWSDLEAALNCDIVSLHVPLTSEEPYATKNLLSQQHIQRLKPGTLLINTSRGEVIDELALLYRQKTHDDLMLVLDVWHKEPNINIELLAHTLIGTPHIAGYSFDGKVRGTEIIYQACCEFLNIQPQWSIPSLKNTADKQVVSIHHNKHDVRDVILHAYNIMEDDKLLKHTLHNHQTEGGLYFDILRKNYPIRREWSHL